jgi:hypothetical protein
VLILAEFALLALLWAVHVPWGVTEGALLLAVIASLLGKRLVGPSEHVQISSTAFITRIQNRYRAEANQLKELGFTPLYFHGEAFPLLRLLLIYPALVFLFMLLNREVADIQNRSKLLFGSPVFNSSDRTTFAHPLQLGMKYHTLFEDGTILLTKNFGGKTMYGTTVIVHAVRNVSISDAWAEHQEQIQKLEAVGKQIDRDISFETYSRITHEA